MRLNIEGSYGCVSDLEWDDIPPFSIVTGVNGVGKTQLLKVIAHSFGVLGDPIPSTQIRAVISDPNFTSSEVVHIAGEWPALHIGSSSEDDVKKALSRANIPDDAPVRLVEHVMSETGLSFEAFRSLPWPQRLEHLRPDLLTRSAHHLDYSDLTFLFLAYRTFEREARTFEWSTEKIRSKFGEPPWELLQDILSTSGLPYRVDIPEEIPVRTIVDSHSFRLRLFDDKGREVPLHSLSSGENVIMSTVFWRYKAHSGPSHAKLLLLDEPDAHLHPSMTRRFIDVLMEVFVKKRDVRVIMTTHSPTTVALAPEKSIFEMRRFSSDAGERISPISRERAISLLTAGFLVVTEQSRFVFVEGGDDGEFYRMLWDLLTSVAGSEQRPALDPFPSLIFQPVGTTQGGRLEHSGKAHVRRLVSELLKLALPYPVHGIVDRDAGEISTPSIHVPVDRRTLENYLYDPLVVWAAVRAAGKAAPSGNVDIPKGDEARIRERSEEELQRIVDAILSSVVSSISPSRKEEEKRTVTLFAGSRSISLRYPGWQLDRPKAQINAAYHGRYKELSRERLLHAYAVVRLIPQDLLSILTDIQNSREQNDDGVSS